MTDKEALDRIDKGMVWFHNNGVECGVIVEGHAAPDYDSSGKVLFNISVSTISGGTITLENWQSKDLFLTKCDCLKAVAEGIRRELNYARCSEEQFNAELERVENQIKAEEQKAQTPKAKISVMFKNEAVVVLPEHVRLSCGHDNVDGFPSLISLIQITNTVLLRYAYLAHRPNPHTCFIFAVGDDRKPAGNRYHKLFDVAPRFGGEIQHDDVVAAVKLLGFELEG